MKKFKDNVEGKKVKPMKSPWDFTCPDYDQRSSNYINAGTHHGVGHAQPIGSMQHTMKGAIPVGKGMGLTVDHIPIKNLIIEFES
jgi:hypothetical protein